MLEVNTLVNTYDLIGIMKKDNHVEELKILIFRAISNGRDIYNEKKIKKSRTQ